jgi:hypothetical protein
MSDDTFTATVPAAAAHARRNWERWDNWDARDSMPSKAECDRDEWECGR